MDRGVYIQHSTFNIQHSTFGVLPEETEFNISAEGTSMSPALMPLIALPAHLDPRSWHWDLLAAFGFCAQALFAGRFIIQWIASERRRASHIPVGFWWLSLSGGVLMTVYGVLRRDPVIILGQAPGLI